MSHDQQRALELSRRERVAKLDRKIGDLAAHIHAATAELLEAAAEFDDLEGWGDWGTRSMAHYLAWKTGMSMAASTRATATAARLKDMPATASAMAAGKLSIDKANSIATVATHENDAVLAGWAQELPVYQLDRLCRSYARVIDETTSAANERHARRYLRYGYDDDRWFYLNGRFSAEAGAVIAAALDKTADELRDAKRGAGSAGPHSDEINVRDHFENTCADALVELAHRVFNVGFDETPSEAYQVMVHVDHGVVTGDDSGGYANIDGTVGLSGATAKRLCCDQPLVPIVTDGDTILSVGRKSRAVPRRIDRALRVRDKTCRFPNCSSVHFIDRHHVLFWGHGGATSLTNLVRLCRFHHRLVHEGGYTMTFDGTTARFFNPFGNEVLPSPPLHEPEQTLGQRYASADPPIDHNCLPPAAENEIDHDLAVSCLVQVDNLGGRGP